ncbi:MAG: eL32 family ribosomal protein [Nanoarchaeota archaeon]
MTDHIDLKRRIKAKKPHFIRQDAHKQKKLKKTWRKPKGKTNKVRLRKRGYVRMVETGWGSPRDTKGTLIDGKRPIIITTIKDIEKLNKKTDAAVISGKLGARKKIIIIEELKKKGIPVANFNPEDYLRTIETRKQERKKKQEEKKQKDTKKTKTPEKTTKPEEQTETLSDEDKKKQEKEEKDKILTKRE